MSSLAEKYDFDMFTDYGNTAPAIPQERPVPKRQPKVVRVPKSEPKPQKRVKRNWAQIIAYSFVFITVTGLAGLRVEKEVELTVLTDQIQQTQQLLAEAQATEAQLTMKMESYFNTLDFEKYVRNELGMQPIQRNQVTYINALQQDRGVVHQEIERPWYQKIINSIKNLFE